MSKAKVSKEIEREMTKDLMRVLSDYGYSIENLTHIEISATPETGIYFRLDYRKNK